MHPFARSRWSSVRVATFGLLAICVWLGASAAAHAHMTLTEPAPSIVDNSSRNQKVGPCGSGTPSNEVTEFDPGEIIMVKWDETIPHPGHWRISLVKNPSELQDPDIETDGQCNYVGDPFAGTKPAYVLMDNVHPRTEAGFGETFEQAVTLPNEPCENCTLQVIQWMTEHFEPCIYYHCATITIRGGGNAGASGGGAGGTGGSSGMGGMAGMSGGGAGGAGGGGAASGSGGMTGVAGMLASTAGSGAGGAGAPAMPAGGAGGSGMVGAPITGMTAGTGVPPTTPQSGSDSGGCSAAASPAANGALVALIASALVPLARRRRAPQ